MTTRYIKPAKKNKVSFYGFYHMVHEFVYRNSKRDVDRSLKVSAVDGFGLTLGRSLALRFMENKMKLAKKDRAS